MAETKKLAATVRSGTGKGAARSTRREGRTPAVLYGGGEAPTPLSLVHLYPIDGAVHRVAPGATAWAMSRSRRR